MTLSDPFAVTQTAPDYPTVPAGANDIPECHILKNVINIKWSIIYANIAQLSETEAFKTMDDLSNCMDAAAGYKKAVRMWPLV
jgi:hypothetical protein